MQPNESFPDPDKHNPALSKRQFDNIIVDCIVYCNTRLIGYPIFTSTNYHPIYTVYKNQVLIIKCFCLKF